MYMSEIKTIPIRLPVAQNSETVSKSNFAVTVKKDGALYLEDNKIEMKQLVANAAAESKRDAAFSVIIRADGEANYKTVIKLMDELKGAGVTRFGLATDLGDGKCRIEADVLARVLPLRLQFILLPQPCWVFWDTVLHKGRRRFLR